MDKLKKEWASIVIIVWLVGVTLFLFNMRDKIDQLQVKSDKIADTLETAEGVIIGVDSGVQESNKKIEKIESQVNYIVKKVRRR